jgi:1-acyl-sn-glycerol-3-phosphate acyltransferase
MIRRWLAYLWYEFDWWMTFAACTFAFSLRLEGQRHMPMHGPVLLIANHQSFLDPVVVGLAARRHLCYLARKTLFRNKFFGWLIRSLQSVPIDQEGFARGGLRTIIEQLQAGKAVLIFPEGERSHDGKMQEFRGGVLLAIKKVQLRVVPVGVAGAYEAWPRWRLFPTFRLLFFPGDGDFVAVSVGPPIESTELNAMPRDAAVKRLTIALKAQVARAEKLRSKKS